MDVFGFRFRVSGVQISPGAPFLNIKNPNTVKENPV